LKGKFKEWLRFNRKIILNQGRKNDMFQRDLLFYGSKKDDPGFIWQFLNRLSRCDCLSQIKLSSFEYVKTILLQDMNSNNFSEKKAGNYLKSILGIAIAGKELYNYFPFNIMKRISNTSGSNLILEFINSNEEPFRHYLIKNEDKVLNIKRKIKAEDLFIFTDIRKLSGKNNKNKIQYFIDLIKRN
jgi:hypothetical protein